MSVKKKWYHRLFKTCEHEYHETGIQRHDPIFGGYRMFVCSKCNKVKYFYIPSLYALNEKIKLYQRYNIPTKFTMVRIFDDGDR